MRIAIDARLNAYRQGGIPQYTRQLLTALAQVGGDDHRFISLQHRDHLRPLAVAPNVVRRTVLTPPHHRFEQWSLPLEVLLARPDVLHCPDFIAPIRRSCPAVVTIHDLAFLHYPEILDDAARAYYGQIKGNAARADRIIAVSEATRQDIAQFLDIPIEEITVIHEAAAPLYGRLDLREGEARVLGSTPVAADTFMLFVSTLEPRKNLPTLLHALRICIDRRPDRPYKLVVAGARGWRDEQIFATARDLRLEDHVLFVGAIGQYDLRWLYNACRLYINPSLYEGFGLPLLEAMACGAPCLAAATSSLPEIGGDAALYIPPLDAGLWADAIEALWDDQERREELGRLGRVQAQRFSWMRAARETLKVYQRAVERVGARVAQPEAAEAGKAAADQAADTLATPGAASEARICLRCGTLMLHRQLQRGILLAQPEQAADDRRLATQTWLCPRCGHVELVVEQVTALATPAEVAPEAGLAIERDRALDKAAAVGAAPIEPVAAFDEPVELVEIALEADAGDAAPQEQNEDLAGYDEEPELAELAAAAGELPRPIEPPAMPDSDLPAADEAARETAAFAAEPADRADTPPAEEQPGAATTLVFELPPELAAQDEQIVPASAEPPDEQPGAATTLVFELPPNGAEPPATPPAPHAETPESEPEPVAPAARNGRHPPGMYDAPAADTGPKKPRQTRSKRKR